MIRIALVQLGYESNTFAAQRAQLEDLGPEGWIAADTVAARFTGTHRYRGCAGRCCGTGCTGSAHGPPQPQRRL